MRAAIVGVLALSLSCGGSPTSGERTPSTPTVGAEVVEAPVEECRTTFGPIGTSLVEGVEGTEPNDDPLPEEEVWLAMGATVEGVVRDGYAFLTSPVRAVFSGVELARTCDRRIEVPATRPVPTNPQPVAVLDGLAVGEVEVDAIDASGIARLVGADLEVLALRGLARGDFAVALLSDADAEEVAMVALLASNGRWGVIDRHSHSTIDLAWGASDLDHDGVDDAWYATESDDGTVVASIAWSFSRRMTRLTIPNDGGRATACFAMFEGGPAFIETLVRGGSSGFRVHRIADGAFEVRSGLLGRVLAAVSYQRADALVPEPRSEIWDGGDGTVDETYFQSCPLDGRAIDVPRDAHYPVEDDPVADAPAILRVHGLAQSYDALPPGAGPIVEMQTTSATD